MTEKKILWEPSPEFIKGSVMYKYVSYLNDVFGYDFEISENALENVKHYDRLWRWSVEKIEDFWESIWQYFRVTAHTPYSTVLTTMEMPGARWFVGAKLNYAEHVFARAKWGEEAVVYVREDGVRRSLTWNALARQVASVADWLKEIGIKKGDRVAAYVSSIPEAVVALLATASIGAIWVATGADMAPRAVIERYNLVEPKILFAVDGYQYNGKEFRKADDVSKVIKAVSSIERVVWINNLYEDIPRLEKPTYSWNEIAERRGLKLSFEPVEFNEPLWVLFTSGTTGIPKPITHGHGGILLEALKTNMHQDLKEGDNFTWYTSPSWMMWNYLVDGLLSSAKIVFYDGSPTYRKLTPLWELAEKEKLAILGVSAPFLHGCMKESELEPKSQFDLSKLKMIGSTAAPLSPAGFEWVYSKVKEDVWLNSLSGGTDLNTAIVGGCPFLPVWSGEIQCRWLGAKVESYNVEGKPIINELGELVIELPMPSMPLYFWGDDPEMSWYKRSYFEMFPGKWRHGDWIMITDRGTVVITGRSDSSIKRRGVRMGTIDFYKVVEELPEVQDSLVLDIKGYLILFVALKPGLQLTGELKQKINTKLRKELGPYFIADYIIQVPDIPMTLNYKKVEVPLKRVLTGQSMEKAVKLESLQNPEAFKKAVEVAKPIIEEIISKEEG
ncbi:acetoacetate--CoA ligase [Archaeoglobales archaeon]|nr:MAG: acetoacetate--CoA ligase [Archaeoglobales archaeon]